MIDKSKLPTVSYEGMNAMHYEEVARINGLLEKLDKGAAVSEITEAVEALLEHMQEHFDYEEGMLQNRGFGMFDIHRSDHNRIMGETRMAYMNWRNFKDREALKAFMEEEFIEWLNLHIQAMDSVAADFLNRLERDDDDSFRPQ
ncbi:bacteriohemerythrin [Hydrogenimonas urashimensis]|uniref:bacteriohemerythrin n=1 Tax=Hydrogenimonas urashimensis TaxID=2740515 RepID=UPI0019156A6F|nr:hemerythrin family protein [Hydrogenimonas urashimensis]